MSIRSMAIGMGLLASAATASAQERLTGTWLTADGSSHVAFAPCGTADCGRIVWLRETHDPQTGQPWQDKFNPDETHRRRSLVGLTLVSELRPAGAQRWDGALYNPLDGRTYSGIFQMVGSGKLQLKGCALAGLICQTEIWTSVVR